MKKIKDEPKENQPTKSCKQCGKPFQYRSHWKENWSQVKFCSKKCRLDFKKTQITK